MPSTPIQTCFFCFRRTLVSRSCGCMISSFSPRTFACSMMTTFLVCIGFDVCVCVCVSPLDVWMFKQTNPFQKETFKPKNKNTSIETLNRTKKRVWKFNLQFRFLSPFPYCSLAFHGGCGENTMMLDSASLSDLPGMGLIGTTSLWCLAPRYWMACGPQLVLECPRKLVNGCKWLVRGL